jgi:rare lipoprotein A
MSPAFACGGAPVAKTYRKSDAYGERTYRRQATSKSKAKRSNVAKTEETKAKKQSVTRVEKPAEKPQAKIELPEKKQPEKKQQQAAIAPPIATAPDFSKKGQLDGSGETLKITSTQSGMASYYWQGQMTASGARFNPSAMTAAHRTLPFGTKVRVTNKRNGKTVVVTINDRGPFIRGRIIDLSNAAAGVIGMRSAGVAPVMVERIAKN